MPEFRPTTDQTMKILVLGARGFIGGRIADRLEEEGHIVVRAGRPDFDFANPPAAGEWQARLGDAQLVVNAVGIFRESGAQTFEAVHFRGPVALFEACAARGIAVIQVSALGADESAATPFLRTKGRADAALLRLDVPSLVLQPSLVFGASGASARTFLMMASLAVIPVPGRGEQRIQPVHVDDLADAVRQAVARGPLPRARVPVVGPAPVTLRDYLARLRAAMGFGKARFLPVSMALMRLASRARVGLLDPDALRMLESGNVASADALAEVLGRLPRAPERFVPAAERAPLATRADLDWLLPLLRVSVAIIWIAAGVVSVGPYPVAESLDMLRQSHITGRAAYLALYGAAFLDFAIGIGILRLDRRRWLWALQAAVIVGYTAIITLFLPEQWLHPYGPVVKNIPLLVAILLLYRMEPR